VGSKLVIIEIEGSERYSSNDIAKVTSEVLEKIDVSCCNDRRNENENLLTSSLLHLCY
jgi:hypothetical protein